MVIVLWLLCALVTAAIAESKKRSVVGWFFVGVFIGIFGIILVAVLPSLAPAEPMQVVYAPHPSQQLPATANESPMQALAQLGNLHQQGMITEAEFLAKKQELLSRV